MSDHSAAQLRRAVANARVLADELARRDTGGRWTQNVTIDARFTADGTTRIGSGSAEAIARWGHRRAAVVCWDLGHNPAGRAMVLADLHLESMRVDLVGPLWSRFGNRVWGPIEDGDYSTQTFTCDRMADFTAKAYAMASHRTYDLVHVCKPRLPGLILGSMLATASDCPIIIDVDDEEQAFFADAGQLDVAAMGLDDLHEPTEALGTAHGVALARDAKVRTVSNVELQREYGGIMVRHARSETAFDPGVVPREAGRSRLQAAPEDFVVLFVGTPRPHKGLDVVVEALRLLDDRFALHVVGVTNRARFDEEIDTTGVRVVTHRPTDMAILPELIAGADAIALMQHLDDPITDYQIPSKISDGLSMGCPVIITDAPPMRDLTDHGLLRANDASELAGQLEKLVEGEADDARTIRRQAFLSDFSIGVNAARARLAEAAAKAAHDSGPDPVVGATLDLTRRAYIAERRRERPDLFDSVDPDRATGLDIVFFWKQNDTGIYGRRSDMLAKYFAADPRIRRVLHFDKPLSTERAARDAQLRVESGADHAPFLSKELLDRRLEVIQAGAVHHRTFLYTDGTTRDPISGDELPDEDSFADFVAAEMAALDMDPARTLAWVCPVSMAFPSVHEAIGFGAVISDVIDDERAFNHRRDVAEQIDRHYREILGLSDCVFTNCEPNAAAFREYADDMTVVPNGAETTAFTPDRGPFDDDPPVVAYVGNMSDRVDWGLLHDLALQRPDYRFLMVGSAHYGADVHDLADRHDNVELVGVVPYADLPELLRGVDVALVPHLEGPLTERMNPLKVYNYYAAGLPIVSTPIPNLGEFAGEFTVATDSRSFAEAIDAGIERRRSGAVARDPQLLESIDWSTRARSILDHLQDRGLLSP